MRRSLWRGLRTLLRPRAAAQDLEDELQHFLDQTTQALISQGMSPEEALRTARLEVGKSGFPAGFPDLFLHHRQIADLQPGSPECFLR